MTLVCLLPVRNAAAELPAYLESAARCCDAVVALDDGSTDATHELLESSPLVAVLLTNPPRHDFGGWDDGENRNRLLDAAAELDPDWVLALDADERLDPGDAAALRSFVDGDALPGCAYALQHFRMWGPRRYDPEYRWIYRLFAYEPGQSLPRERLHFDPVPSALPRVRTTIRVQHFAAATERRRLARLRKYAEADPEAEYPTDFAGLDEKADGRRLPTWRPRPAALPVLLPPVS